MRNWKINLVACLLAQFFCIAGFSAAFPFLPFFIRDLGISDLNQVALWAGTLNSGAAISMALVSPIWGLLADRHGRKLMVERAAFGGAIILTCMAFADSVQQLFVLRLVQGVLTGTVPAFMTLTATLAPPSQAGFALGLMQMAVYMGSSVGPVIGGFVADQIGYRWTFAATGLMLFLGGILVYFLVQENFKRPEGQQTRNGIAASARTILRSAPVLGAVLALGAIYMGNATPQPTLSLFVETLQRDPALVNTATGSVFGASAVASAIAAAAIGRLSDRKGYRIVLMACSLGAGLAYLGQGLSPSFSVLLMASFATGFFIGGLMPSANAILARTTPKDQRGAVYGISNSINAAGRAIGPMLGATLTSALGLRTSFFAAAAIFILVLVGVGLGLRTSETA